jgi:hypothetical protein
MKSIFVLGVLGCLASPLLTGCASAGGAGLQPQPLAPGDVTGFAAGAPSMKVGGPLVVDARVNPLAPMNLGLDSGAVVVSFERFGRAHARAALDPLSFASRPEVPGASPSANDVGSTLASTEVQRVTLDGGRFLVCWTTGSPEWGHRAMAQVFNSSDGSPRGAPVAISPSDADVIGMPRAITSDGHRVVAMFKAESGSSFELVAVPLDDASPSDRVESARR